MLIIYKSIEIKEGEKAMVEFNHNLVTGIPDDHVEIAVIISRFVETDVTEPQLPDGRNAWLSDYELRLLEKPVGYDARHWDWYADVCRRAATLVQNPNGRALLILARLNGERRVPDPNWELVAELAQQTREIIDSLQTGARKERLASLLEYNLGIVARYVGDYERAILQQVTTAEKAETGNDYVGVAIARLCEAVERFNASLSNGSDTTALINPLHEAGFRVAATCTGNDNTQVSWRLYSAPVHVLQAHIWSVRQISPHDEKFWLHLLTEQLPIADRNRFDINQPTIVSIRAGLAFLKNKRIEALRLANEVETTMHDQARADARMTARLIMAMLAADAHLKVIVEEGNYMYQLRRMAQRILSGEVRQWCDAHAQQHTQETAVRAIEAITLRK